MKDPLRGRRYPDVMHDPRTGDWRDAKSNLIVATASDMSAWAASERRAGRVPHCVPRDSGPVLRTSAPSTTAAPNAQDVRSKLRSQAANASSAADRRRAQRALDALEGREPAPKPVPKTVTHARAVGGPVDLSTEAGRQVATAALPENVRRFVDRQGPEAGAVHYANSRLYLGGPPPAAHEQVGDDVPMPIASGIAQRLNSEAHGNVKFEHGRLTLGV